MHHNLIKKLLSLCLALAMAFSLTACWPGNASLGEDIIQSLTTKDDLEENQAEAEAENEAEEPKEPVVVDGRYSDEEIAVEYKKFSEMEYSRPDLQAFTDATEKAVEVLNSDASYDEVCLALDEYEALCNNFSTMYVLAEIRSYLDMTDEYYSDEYAWVEENLAVFSKAEDHLFYAAAASSYVDRLEEEYFWDGFAEEYADESDSIYTESYMALDKQEKELLAEYRDLISNPTIIWRGQERNIDELLDTLMGQDYLDALEKYYDKFNPKLADIYIRLIKVRNALAEEQGYESYELMQYDSGFERDYTPEDAEVLIQSIRKYAVPAYEKINSQHSYYDVDYFEVPENLLLSLTDNFTGNMGGDIRAAFEFMKEYELYDVSISSKKMNISFESYIKDFESPFIFIDSYGDSEDIMTFAHEFGHFCRDYVNYGLQQSVDVQEVFSQAMEYLSLFHLDNTAVSEDELYSLLLMKTLEINNSYVQAGYAEFEHRIYSMDPDKLTAEKINDVWLEICQDYNMAEEGYEYLYKMMWIDISHFFEYPFYVISYAVSNELALQIFLESENAGAGLELYEKMLVSDSEKILDLVEECGLENPFSEERVKKSVEFLLNISKNVL